MPEINNGYGRMIISSICERCGQDLKLSLGQWVHHYYEHEREGDYPKDEIKTEKKKPTVELMGAIPPMESYYVCSECGARAEYTECDECMGDGLFGHDCGEDTCCCLEPEDNMECETCEGEGGWYECPLHGELERKEGMLVYL